MFNFGKNKIPEVDGLPPKLTKFLDIANDEYIKAFQTKTPSILKLHFTRDCCMAIGRWSAAEAGVRYFPDKKFCNTSWSLIQFNAPEYKLEKSCVYRDVTINIGKKMKLSDDYKESWVVQEQDGNYLVKAITPVNE